MSLNKHLTTENHGIASNIIGLANRITGTVIDDYDERMKVFGTCVMNSHIENKASFVRNRKYEKLLDQLQNTLVLLIRESAYLGEKYSHNTYYIILNNGNNAIVDTYNFFYDSEFLITEQEITRTAKIHNTARIGKDVYVR